MSPFVAVDFCFSMKEIVGVIWDGLEVEAGALLDYYCFFLFVAWRLVWGLWEGEKRLAFLLGFWLRKAANVSDRIGGQFDAVKIQNCHHTMR
jgi:hypothetical protein